MNFPLHHFRQNKIPLLAKKKYVSYRAPEEGYVHEVTKAKVFWRERGNHFIFFPVFWQLSIPRKNLEGQSAEPRILSIAI